ncbi:hypothetical protein KAR91_04870 [Candidatus Pacearchaeota archaeon]|nr:hypothetical protein [Candidatus Pacearchaeota archaeon]
MSTLTREEEHVADTKRYYDSISEEATELWQYIENDTMPEPDPLTDDYMHHFESGSFDAINWINQECLEANSHDLLLATGGPAYGVTNVNGCPVFWFQDWFTEKFCKQLQGDAFDFYVYIFEYLEELA